MTNPTPIPRIGSPRSLPSPRCNHSDLSKSVKAVVRSFTSKPMWSSTRPLVGPCATSALANRSCPPARLGRAEFFAHCAISLYKLRDLLFRERKAERPNLPPPSHRPSPLERWGRPQHRHRLGTIAHNGNYFAATASHYARDGASSFTGSMW